MGRTASPGLSVWAYAAVFVAALIGSIQRNDLSPVVHPDTAFELALVQECLRGEGCTTLGGSASFSGIYHMVGWLNFVVLAEWLGLGRDAIHLLVQVANAVRIVLVMLVAGRLGGAPAAALAPYFAFETSAQPGVLYDTSLMAFFGTVLLVQCVAAAAERPPARFLVLAALVAAVIAEIHLAGAMALVSVVWVAFLHTPNRVRRVALVTLVFVAAVLVISPMSIAWNLSQVVARLAAGMPGAASPIDGLQSRLQNGIAALSFLVPWMVYRIGRPWLGEPPPGLRGAMAVCVPLAGAYAVGVLIGAMPATALHYLEHGYPAKAVVLAVPLAVIGASIWRWVASLLAIPVAVRGLASWMVPLILSLLAAGEQTPGERLLPRWADVQALARLLHDDWQWDWPTVQRALRSPEKMLLLVDLSAAVPGWETDASPPAREAAESIAVVAVGPGRVPDPLPDGWIVVSRRRSQTLLAVPLRSSLDWSDQAICIEDRAGRETCVGPPIDAERLEDLREQVPEMRRWVRRVRWRGAEGAVESIVMPEIPLTCAGRIVQAPPGSVIDAGGRRARVTGHGEVAFEWLPNSPDCSSWDFLKLDDPPFLITGDGETVDRLARILDRGRT